MVAAEKTASVRFACLPQGDKVQISDRTPDPRTLLCSIFSRGSVSITNYQLPITNTATHSGLPLPDSLAYANGGDQSLSQTDGTEAILYANDIGPGYIPAAHQPLDAPHSKEGRKMVNLKFENCVSNNRSSKAR